MQAVDVGLRWYAWCVVVGTLRKGAVASRQGAAASCMPRSDAQPSDFIHGCLPPNCVATALPIWLHACPLQGGRSITGEAVLGSLAHRRTSLTVSVATLPLLPQGRSITGELVFGYLAHQGHWDTAAAVARDVLGGTVAVAQQDVQDMQVGWQLALQRGCCGEGEWPGQWHAMCWQRCSGCGAGRAGHAGGQQQRVCRWAVL